MIVIRYNGKDGHIYACDACGYTKEFFDQGLFNFSIESSEARKHGWTFIGGEIPYKWEHYCPKCSKIRSGKEED